MEKLLKELEQYIDKRVPCVVCEGSDFSNWATQGYFHAMKCNQCGMLSVNPHYTEEGLDKFYSDYYKNRTADIELGNLRRKMYVEDRDWIQNYIDGGKVLDIGCSDGSFLSFFNKDSWDKNGIDLTTDALEIAKNKHGVSTYQGKVWETDVGEEYDLVMMRGVIEHFKDPIVVLQKCVDILKPNGLLYITATPAGNSFAFNVYRHKWRMFTPDHIHFFTVDLLTDVLSKMGMSLVARHYQYEETPYASIEDDYKKIMEDIITINNDNSLDNITLSPPFPGTMITAVWKKLN